MQLKQAHLISIGDLTISFFAKWIHNWVQTTPIHIFKVKISAFLYFWILRGLTQAPENPPHPPPVPQVDRRRGRVKISDLRKILNKISKKY